MSLANSNPTGYASWMNITYPGGYYSYNPWVIGRPNLLTWENATWLESDICKEDCMKNKHHKDYPVGSPMNVTLKLVLADDPLLNEFNVVSWFYLGQVSGIDGKLDITLPENITAGLYELEFSLYTSGLHGGTLGSTGFHILNRTEAATMSLTDLPSASATSTQAVVPYLEAFPDADGARSLNVGLSSLLVLSTLVALVVGAATL